VLLLLSPVRRHLLQKHQYPLLPNRLPKQQTLQTMMSLQQMSPRRQSKKIQRSLHHQHRLSNVPMSLALLLSRPG
jgi:hypothetical protein